MQQEVKRFGPHHASPAVDLDSDNGQYNGHERGKRAWLTLPQLLGLPP